MWTLIETPGLLRRIVFPIYLIFLKLVAQRFVS